jgi:hypothetical protein
VRDERPRRGDAPSEFHGLQFRPCRPLGGARLGREEQIDEHRSEAFPAQAGKKRALRGIMTAAATIVRNQHHSGGAADKADAPGEIVPGVRNGDGPLFDSDRVREGKFHAL